MITGKIQLVWETVLKFSCRQCHLFQSFDSAQMDSFNSLMPAFVSIYPYIVYSSIFMGWRFSRSRLIFTLIILTIADRTLRQLSFQTPWVDVDRMFSISSAFCYH